MWGQCTGGIRHVKIFDISSWGDELEGTLCKREDKISCEDVVHNIVYVVSLNKPLPLVSRVTSLPAHVTLLVYLRPCVAHGNRHTGPVRDDKDLCYFVYSHTFIEELACSGGETWEVCVCVCVCACVRAATHQPAHVRDRCSASLPSR